MAIEKLAERLLSKIEKTEKQTQFMLDFFFNHPSLENYSYTLHDNGVVWFKIPYSTVALSQFREIIGQGWKRGWEWRTDEGKGIEYEYDGIKICVLLDVTEQGATCHRIKAGETVVPIYEVVCD